MFELLTALILSRSINALGDTDHTVPYGTDPLGAVSRHFVPGYHHIVPTGQKYGYCSEVITSHRRIRSHANSGRTTGPYQLEMLCKLQSISELGTKENMRTAIVTTVFFFTLCDVWAETSSSEATSPTKIVSDLYRAHNGKADPLQYPASKKLLGAYFEKGLLSLFVKDQSESHGEVGKLDFDPLYAAQDFEIKDFSVALVAQQKDSAEVAASFKNAGTSEKIVFLLSNTKQGWRITDIKYSDGRTLKAILK